MKWYWQPKYTSSTSPHGKSCVNTCYDVRCSTGTGHPYADRCPHARLHMRNWASIACYRVLRAAHSRCYRLARLPVTASWNRETTESRNVVLRRHGENSEKTDVEGGREPGVDSTLALTDVGGSRAVQCHVWCAGRWSRRRRRRKREREGRGKTRTAAPTTKPNINPETGANNRNWGKNDNRRNSMKWNSCGRPLVLWQLIIYFIFSLFGAQVIFFI